MERECRSFARTRCNHVLQNEGNPNKFLWREGNCAVGAWYRGFGSGVLCENEW